MLVATWRAASRKKGVRCGEKGGQLSARPYIKIIKIGPPLGGGVSARGDAAGADESVHGAAVDFQLLGDGAV